MPSTPSGPSRRVVFDTSIFLSALIFGGKPGAAWQLARTGEIELVTSPVILAEFARVLQDKFSWVETDIAEAIKTVGYSSQLVKPNCRIAALADDADNRVLEAAVDGRADLIVSGDSHLLELQVSREIRIVRAAELLLMR